MREPAERIALLETMLAALIDHVDQVGCFNRFGERLGDQVPVVKQARMVLGDDAWTRVIGAGQGLHPSGKPG